MNLITIPSALVQYLSAIESHKISCINDHLKKRAETRSRGIENRVTVDKADVEYNIIDKRCCLKMFV